MFKYKNEALALVGSIGQTSKMPAQSWGILAKRCITGAKLAKIEGTICEKCYALRGAYQYSSVVSSQELRLQKFNESLSKDNGESWIEAMAYLIGDDKYFRLFDSGDLQSEEMLDVFCRLARRLPKCKFWNPSKELGIVSSYISKGNIIPKNLIIRLSAYKFEEKGPVKLAKRLGVNISAASKENFTCPASKQDNNCGDCRKCWTKSVFSVTYKRH